MTIKSQTVSHHLLTANLSKVNAIILQWTLSIDITLLFINVTLTNFITLSLREQAIFVSFIVYLTFISSYSIKRKKSVCFSLIQFLTIFLCLFLQYSFLYSFIFHVPIEVKKKKKKSVKKKKWKNTLYNKATIARDLEKTPLLPFFNTFFIPVR